MQGRPFSVTTVGHTAFIAGISVKRRRSKRGARYRCHYNYHHVMKWITREKIKVDRVACPWLIKKFIDQDAEFVFLPRDTEWAKIEDGIVFDVANCELGHH